MGQELQGDLVTLKSLDESLFNDYLTMFSPVVMNTLHVSSIQAEQAYLKPHHRLLAFALTSLHLALNSLSSLLQAFSA